jgi:predicted dienelactone hydrolase
MAGKYTYDPLAVSQGLHSDSVDFDIRDSRRQRDIPVRMYVPQTDSPSPVVLFSHGLGGSREGSSYLGKHWASRGYFALFVQHPGSDDAVWKGKPKAEYRALMRAAASVQNFLLRVQDIVAVLDALADRSQNIPPISAARLDLKKVGISGHSFGAITSQWLSGQTTKDGEANFADPRISAALIMSPSRSRRSTPKQAFGSVSLPWMLMTGTKDIAQIGQATPDSRLAVFLALPTGSKYELVFFGAHHYAFTDGVLRDGIEPRNPNHHEAILALSTAFWDTYLRADPKAREWLDGNGPRSVLESRDRWQTK